VAAPALIAQRAPVAPSVDQAAPARTTTPATPRLAPQPAEPTNGAAPPGDLSLRAGERKMLQVLAQR